MKTCCFFGHRNTEETPYLMLELKKTITWLISKRDVTTFLFGSASRFDELCVKIVSEFKEEYPDIKLVYVSSHYPYIEREYRDYILETYDDTIFPIRIEKAGRASYVERNQVMIEQSDFCVFYYDENYNPPLRKRSKSSLSNYQPKSGTKLAYEYAKKKEKVILNLLKKDYMINQ